MRKRATQAQKDDRIRFVMDALAREYPDDLILKALIKQGMGQKQAGRYLKDGYQALELLASRHDPVQWGKAIHRANNLAKTTYQAAVKDGDPDGKKARASVMANKNAIDIAKTVTLLRKEMSPDVSSKAPEPAEADELESILQRFAQG